MKVWPEKTIDTEFKDLGDLGFTGALQDRQFAYLRDQGYTNALDDMLAALRGGAGGSSLLSLLQNSTAGFFYPVETTRLFQDDSDVSSSQYVLSDSDPIGLHVDAMAGVTVTEGSPRTFSGLGDELVTNGGFDTDLSGWTFDNTDPITIVTTWDVGGYATLTRGSGGITGSPEQTFSGLEVGKAYLLQFDILSGGAERITLIWAAMGLSTQSKSGVGTYSIVGVYAGGTSFIKFWNTGNNEFANIDNVSVRELPGLHATQATSADRPLWDTTEEAWELDGVTDHIVVPDPSAVGIGRLGVNIKTSDVAFVLYSEEGAAVPNGPWINSGNGNEGSDADKTFVDGVEIFNPTRDDMFSAISDGAWHHVVSEDDFSPFPNGICIGAQGDGGWDLAGFLSHVYLTDITDSAQLDAIADAAMSERGITNLRSKTAEEVTQEATDGNLYGSPTASDNDPIATLPATVGDIDFTQSTSGDRPAFDAATGLLDFDGVSDHLTADLTGISDRTNMYGACLIKTTDTKFMLWTGGAGVGSFIGSAEASASTAISSAGTNPVFWVDTALQSYADRQDVLDSLSDDTLHLFEFTADLTNSNFNEILFAKYFNSGWELDGLALPLYLGPDPGIIERNILRKHWKQQFPGLSY